MRRRGPREVAFRLKQSASNVRRLLSPPRPDAPKAASLPLADGAAVAAKLRGAEYAAEVERLAGSILAHRFPLLGGVVETGAAIEWRKDYLHGQATGLGFFARIPYLDFVRAGDHKPIWELNRHQHLVLLAQAWLLSGREEFLEEVWRQIADWLGQNPYPRGINWASALEVAFRALSWLWIDHLAGARMPDTLRRAFLRGLFIHGLHLRGNLSVYFSPNTHLLGEAVALHALGLFFDRPEWRQTAGAVLDREVLRQVREDGAYFEQSSYYHVYALDMLLFHAILRPPAAPYRERLARMAHYLHSLAGPREEIPFLGDDDGGRFFHPFGAHARYGRATLAACAAFGIGGPLPYRAEDLYPLAAWWLGATEGSGAAELRSELFRDSGFAVLVDGGAQCVVDAGPFGPISVGHTHASKLSFTLRSGEEWLLIDPGTYTYVADAALRRLFRGTAMHNTIRIDGLDQAEPAGPFAWRGRPYVAVTQWNPGARRDEIAAECRYRGFTHRRRIEWEKPSRIVVTDEIDGPPSEHMVEQFWHTGPGAGRLGPRTFRLGLHATIALDGEAEIAEGGEFGWRSPAFGVRVPSPVIRLNLAATLPARLVTRIALSE